MILPWGPTNTSTGKCRMRLNTSRFCPEPVPSLSNCCENPGGPTNHKCPIHLRHSSDSCTHYLEEITDCERHMFVLYIF